MPKTLTINEVITQTYEYAKNMKEPSSDNADGCLYRSGDGNKCLAGNLIPDKYYDPAMEKQSIATNYRNYPEIKKIIGDNLDLWIDLQNAHDAYTNYPFDKWHEIMLDKIRNIAVIYNCPLV